MGLMRMGKKVREGEKEGRERGREEERTPATWTFKCVQRGKKKRQKGFLIESTLAVCTPLGSSSLSDWPNPD